METPNKRQALKELNNELKTLQEKLSEENKRQGINDFIDVRLATNQAHSERIKGSDGEVKGLGKFYLELVITAKASDVYIPLSVASGKNPAGFIYLIEGTSAGKIVTAGVKCQGSKTTQLTVGATLLAKIPAGQTGTFIIQTVVSGKLGQTYKIIINCIRYKSNLSTVRYEQYVKEIPSEVVKLA